MDIWFQIQTVRKFLTNANFAIKSNAVGRIRFQGRVTDSYAHSLLANHYASGRIVLAAMPATCIHRWVATA